MSLVTGITSLAQRIATEINSVRAEKVSADGSINTHSDVDVSGVSDGDIFAYDAASGMFLPSRRKAEIRRSGRFYLDTDNRWITSSDDLYGTNYYQFAENAGTGATPITEWEHMGEMIKAGTTIKTLNFAARANNLEVTDLEFYIIARQPNPITRWQTGLDNDGEDVNTLLHNGLYHTPAVGVTFSGAMNDLHWREIDINHTVTEDCILSIYLRPLGTITARRYLYSSWLWELDL